MYRIDSLCGWLASLGTQHPAYVLRMARVIVPLESLDVPPAGPNRRVRLVAGLVATLNVSMQIMDTV